MSNSAIGASDCTQPRFTAVGARSPIRLPPTTGGLARPATRATCEVTTGSLAVAIANRLSALLMHTSPAKREGLTGSLSINYRTTELRLPDSDFARASDVERSGRSRRSDTNTSPVPRQQERRTRLQARRSPRFRQSRVARRRSARSGAQTPPYPRRLSRKVVGIGAAAAGCLGGRSRWAGLGGVGVVWWGRFQALAVAIWCRWSLVRL